MENENFSFYSNVADGFQRSHGVRRENHERSCEFGVAYLDHALGGLQRNDLCILAGDSGIGKSELSVHIAAHNALNGKKVLFLALEHDRDEVSHRVGYKALVNNLYRSQIISGQKPNYLEWMMGRQEKLFESFYPSVQEKLKTLDNLRVVYRNEEFTIDDLEKCFMSVKNDTDLVVLDHLHFLDFDDSNENKAYKEIIKRIRTLVNKYRTPVLALAHIRKQDRRYSELVPSQEDIHGSSDIFKAVTKTITIAGAYNVKLNEGQAYRFPTYVRICKCRYDGSRKRYVGLVVFNARENVYEPQYRLGTLTAGKDQWEELPQADYPFWARIST